MATGGLPADAIVKIDIESDELTAYITVIPPEVGGRAVTVDAIKKEMSVNGIRFGVDEQIISDIADSGLYDSRFVLARGIKPVDGKDSSIEFFFDRNCTKDLKEDEFGNVDYRDLGFINNVKSGTVVAKITPETEGEPGTSVKGTVLRAVAGKPCTYKPGSYTAFDSDNVTVVTTADGNLRWDKKAFVVDQTVVIGEDVDVSVGNINFLGDVVVKGNVNEGYIVRSDKSVTVKGSVIGATIEAAGDVLIMQGSVSSTIKGKNIKIGFCENSTIDAKATLTSQSFIGCKVRATGALEATGGKAAIVGGKYICLQNISAGIIGSDTYTKTVLILGNNAVLTEEKLAAEGKISELEKQIVQLQQAITLLKEQKKQSAVFPPEREEMLTSSIRGRFIHMTAIKQAKARIARIDAELAVNQDLRVSVRKDLYPGVSIRINNTQYAVETHNVRCVVKIGSNGDIEITSL